MKANKQEKIIADWQKMQKRGLFKHILLAGGIFTLTLNVLSFDWDDLYLFNDLMFTLKFTGKFILTGVAFGLATWYAHRWQYNRIMDKLNEEKEQP